jgi:hypothetical protein
MTNTHNKSFFGQNSALFLKSNSKFDDFIFIQCIKRKGGNVWEKPSKGEGKNIKLSLGEIVMILKVLKGQLDSWSTYHSYKEEGTNISVNWQQNVIWINIGEYSKKLQSPQIEILTLLLDHLLREKIEFATGGQNQDKTKKKDREQKKIQSSTQSSSQKENKIFIKEEIFHPNSESTANIISKDTFKTGKANKARTVKGEIQKATDKALLIQFQDGLEAWIPKSTVHNDFSTENPQLQSFLIESWILEKNKVLS